jgi:hypothetical protein
MKGHWRPTRVAREESAVILKLCLGILERGPQFAPEDQFAYSRNQPKLAPWVNPHKSHRCPREFLGLWPANSRGRGS